MCSICLESVSESELNTNENNSVITTLCNHTFHKKCLQSCIHYGIKECPLCRTNIESDIKKYGFEVKPISSESEYYLDDYYDYDSDDTVPAMDNSDRNEQPASGGVVGVVGGVGGGTDRFHFLYSFGFR